MTSVALEHYDELITFSAEDCAQAMEDYQSIKAEYTRLMQQFDLMEKEQREAPYSI